jgi:hypothetical protein
MSFLFCKFLQRAAKWFTNLSKKRFVDFAHRRSPKSARRWSRLILRVHFAIRMAMRKMGSYNMSPRTAPQILRDQTFWLSMKIFKGPVMHIVAIHCWLHSLQKLKLQPQLFLRIVTCFERTRFSSRTLPVSSN